MIRHIAMTAAMLAALLATTPAHMAATDARPFKATLTGHANPQPTTDPCVLTNTESGTGVAIHLGSIGWTSSETVNFCSNPEGADVNGEFEWTAANGDVISGRYVTLAHPDFVTGVITFSGSWEITGGTGRFAGATGEGTLSGHGSLTPPFEVAATFEGRIAY